MAKQNKSKSKKKPKKEESEYSSEEQPKKKPAKKPTKKSEPPKKHKITKQNKHKGSSDGRGYKPCQGCDNRIHIHRRICTYCGTVNIMKKAKFQLSEIFKSKSSKGLQALLEQNDSNTLPVVNAKETKIKFEQSKPQKHSAGRVILDGKTHTIYMNTFNSLTNNLSVLAAEHPIKYLKFNKSCNVLAFTTQETYECESLTENDRLTLKAYGLDRLEKVGHEYHGYSCIFFSQQPFKKIALRMNIAKVVRQFLWLNQQEFLILCGQGNLHLYRLPAEQPKGDCQSMCSLQGYGLCRVEQLEPCRVPTVACGDNEGNIHVVQIVERSMKIVRSILSAHGSYITAIRNCPINNNNCVMFASGAYDGYVKVWSLKDMHEVYEEEVSNRKVVDMQWDSGAKFLLVLIDDQNEGCVLLSFYSISKNQSKLSLAVETQFRYVKQFTNFTFSSIAYNHQLVGVASQSGVMYTYPLEVLRKLSVKKKKSKTGQSTKQSIKFAMKGDALQINTRNVQSVVVEKQQLVAPLVTSFDLGSTSSTIFMAASTYSNHIVIHQSTI